MIEKNAYSIESNLSHYTDCVVAVTKEDEAVLKKTINSINICYLQILHVV